MSMQVALYYSNTDIRLEELPKPRVAPDEALMTVEASGICGTDLMEWYRKDKVPLVLGHEVAGTILEVGAKVRNFRVGDRIVATHHVPCGECEYCQNGHSTVCETLRRTHFDPGGFAEFVRLTDLHLKLGTFRIPDSLAMEEATFVEPLGCAIRGQRLAQMKKGKRVVVVGCGSAGLLHVKLARYYDAQSVAATDIDSYRLQKAKEFGADEVIHGDEDVVSKLRQIYGGRLADLVILCSAAQSAIAQGLRSVERGGTVLIFTAASPDSCLPVPTNEIFWRQEVTLLSSYAASPEDLKEALTLISKRKIIVRDMITHRFPLQDIQKGFALVAKPRESMKVIIEPTKTKNLRRREHGLGHEK